MTEHADSDSDSKESRSDMINPQILLQESTMNKFQESINESSTSESISEKTRISTRLNKKILISTKFKNENFDKKSERIHMTKLIKNINLDDDDESTIMQEVINHLTREKQ